MIPAEVKLALYRIALFCKEHECSKCTLYEFCFESFDIDPGHWEKMLAED